MAAITATCQKCSKQFLIIDQEQQFLRDKGIPLPVQCPACRQERRLALRGGRQLFRTKCQKCGKDIVTSYDPATATSIILCREDYEKYNAETDLIVNEPLPEVPGTAPSPQPATPQAAPMQQSSEVSQSVQQESAQQTMQQMPEQQNVVQQQTTEQPVQQTQQIVQPQGGNIMGGSGTIMGGQGGNIMGPDSGNNNSTQ
jgi:hypothetical protein